MLSSDRGLFVALVGWLAFFSFISWDAAQQQKPEIYCPETGNPTDCRPQQYTTERAFIPSGFERAISNPEPTTGQDHEKRDLAAQEASAAFAFWMMLIAGFGALVTTIATILLFQQIKLTREAVKDTGDATLAMQEANRIALLGVKASHKPIITVEAVGPYIKTENGYPFESVLREKDSLDVAIFGAALVKNEGKAPITIIETAIYSEGRKFMSWKETMFFPLKANKDVTIAPRTPLGQDGRADWPVGVFKLTIDTVREFKANPPPIMGYLVYDDAIGVRRARYFAFAPTGITGTSPTYRMWGGEEYNYEREIPRSQ
jgi:hypothetical protein